jgi:hypothetical protein
MGIDVVELEFSIVDSPLAQTGVLCSWNCPNCDGDITEDEHSYFGICTSCMHPH